MSSGFIHISKAYQDALEYIKKRRSGEEVSMKTPWTKINESVLNGLEWNTMVVVAGRPGSGKTLFTSMITREAHKLNPDQDFVVLDFQFEMLARQVAMREISANTGIKTKRLASAFDPLADQELGAVMKYVEANKNKPIYTIENVCTVKQMKSKIETALVEFNKPLIVTIDHSVLIAKDASERDVFETLHSLAKMMTEMKKYKIIFIVLSQLNRDVESADRQKNGTYGNYLFDSDIYGGDALLQHADLVLGINNPTKYNLTQYGPEKFIIDKKNMLAIHFLKNRHGEASVLTFMQADFERLTMYEIPHPPKVK